MGMGWGSALCQLLEALPTHPHPSADPAGARVLGRKMGGKAEPGPGLQGHRPGDSPGKWGKWGLVGWTKHAVVPGDLVVPNARAQRRGRTEHPSPPPKLKE